MNKPANGVTAVLVCRVRARLCALPLAAVGEVLRPQPIRPLAAPVPHVAGLARIRGAWLPVVDLATLLGLGDQVVSRYVVAHVGAPGTDRAVALAVSEVLGPQQLPAADVDELPPLLRDADHAAISAIAGRDEELIALLDAARLLPDDALAALPRDDSPSPTAAAA